MDARDALHKLSRSQLLSGEILDGAQAHTNILAVPPLGTKEVFPPTPYQTYRGVLTNHVGIFCEPSNLLSDSVTLSAEESLQHELEPNHPHPCDASAVQTPRARNEG